MIEEEVARHATREGGWRSHKNCSKGGWGEKFERGGQNPPDNRRKCSQKFSADQEEGKVHKKGGRILKRGKGV